jgi:uncharacterized protein with PQ loop repeat
MLTAAEVAGFIGAGLAGAAYIPQISHLIRAHCSAGISRLAFGVWLVASLLVTAQAFAIQAGVFIVLGGIQIVSTVLILFYATRYENQFCPIHLAPNARSENSHTRYRSVEWVGEATRTVHRRFLPMRVGKKR